MRALWQQAVGVSVTALAKQGRWAIKPEAFIEHVALMWRVILPKINLLAEFDPRRAGQG